MPASQPETSVPNRKQPAETAGSPGHAAISSRTVIPAWLARVISMSRPNLSILLRRRSFRRGWVMRRRRAASACVSFQPRAKRYQLAHGHWRSDVSPAKCGRRIAPIAVWSIRGTPRATCQIPRSCRTSRTDPIKINQLSSIAPPYASVFPTRARAGRPCDAQSPAAIVQLRDEGFSRGRGCVSDLRPIWRRSA